MMFSPLEFKIVSVGEHSQAVRYFRTVQFTVVGGLALRR